MKRGWVAVAGLLFLTACRHGTGNDRGAGERRSSGEAARSLAAIPEREAAAARTLAAMRAASRVEIEIEIEMATAVTPRAQTSEVRDYAARIVRQRTEVLEAIAGLVQDRAIDPRLTDADPLVQADLAAGAIRLSRLADQAEGLARDPESTSILRRIAAQARDAQARAFALMPCECGGLRDGRHVAAPHLLPALDDPAGRAAAGAPAAAGSPRSRGVISPVVRTDL